MRAQVGESMCVTSYDTTHHLKIAKVRGRAHESVRRYRRGVARGSNCWIASNSWNRGPTATIFESASPFALLAMQGHPGAEHIRLGDALKLVRERANALAPHATMMVAAGKKAGYVPRPYSGLGANLLDAGVPLEATLVLQLGDPADVGRWVVRIARG